MTNDSMTNDSMTNDKMKKYSNTRATLAIAVASFRSIMRSPSAVVFSLAFPLIFIIVFANIGSSPVTVDVGVAKTCDTTGPVYQVLKNTKVVHLIKDQSANEMTQNLSKGSIDAIINIQKNNSRPPYTLHVQYTKALARLVFSWIGALFIILIGHYFFGFTLVHGVTTVINMLILAAFGLIIFMGFGFIISGIAKNESTVPPLSNIITLPQFLLSGTFFATTAFPSWLQALSNVLPLTYLNKAMRDVAFEGAGLGNVTHQLLILGIWFIIVYAVAVKTFKWE